jgi:hypothetical protein
MESVQLRFLIRGRISWEHGTYCWSNKRDAMKDKISAAGFAVVLLASLQLTPVVAAKPPILVKSLGPFSLTTNLEFVYTQPIDTEGYPVVGVYVVSDQCVPGSGNPPNAFLEWEWAPGAGFVEHSIFDARNAWGVGTGVSAGYPRFFWSQGARLRFRLYLGCDHPVEIRDILVQLREQ